jgi:hypothetical protein
LLSKASRVDPTAAEGLLNGTLDLLRLRSILRGVKHGALGRG